MNLGAVARWVAKRAGRTNGIPTPLGFGEHRGPSLLPSFSLCWVDPPEALFLEIISHTFGAPYLCRLKKTWSV